MSDLGKERTLPAGGVVRADGSGLPAVKLAKSAVLGALFGPSDDEAFGRYQPIRRVGAGASGTVYVARDGELARDVALKVLVPKSGRGLEGAASKRYLREARVIASLSHPNIVEIFDVGVHEGLPYLAMELVDGGSLAEWFRERSRSAAEILDALGQAGRGLAAAHAQGVIHRDFKPANVLIGRDGRVRVADFGLAGIVDTDVGAQARTEDSASEEDRLGLTKTGAVVGTPAFMSPEQHRGETLDARADQYAFCTSALFALMGRLPFEGKSIVDLYVAKMKSPGSMPAIDAVPRRVRAVLIRGVRPRPEDRWPSMEALLKALARARSRRGLGVAVVATGIVAAGVVAASGTGTDACRDAARDLDATWNPETRAALELRFGQLRAPDDAAGVGARLDAYATAWKRARRELCAELERDPQAFDAGRRCLRRQRERFASIVSLLSALDADGDRGRFDALAAEAKGLRVASCGAEARAGAEVPVPTDDARRATVEAVRDRMAALAPRVGIGLVLPDDVALRSVLDDAAATEFEPLRAEADVLMARVLAAASDFEGATERLESAYARATAQDYQSVAFDAARQTFAYYVDKHHDLVQAEQWSSRTKAALVRLGNPPEQSAEYERELGSLAQAKGDPQSATPHFERAIAQLTQLDPLPRRKIAAVLNALSLAHSSLGSPDAALDASRRAYEMLRDELGETHRATISARYNHGAQLSSVRRLDDAEVVLTATLAAIDASAVSFPVLAAVTANELGSIAQVRRDFTAARFHLQRALAEAKKATSARAKLIQFGVGRTLVSVLIALDETTAAVDEAKAALAVGRSLYDDQHPAVLGARWAFADALRASENIAEAEEELERLIVDCLDAEQLDIAALARFSLASVIVDRDRPRALRLARQSKARWEVDAPVSDSRSTPGVAQDRIATIERWLAKHAKP